VFTAVRRVHTTPKTNNCRFHDSQDQQIKQSEQTFCILGLQANNLRVSRKATRVEMMQLCR
jgi:hypothetical protein